MKTVYQVWVKLEDNKDTLVSQWSSLKAASSNIEFHRQKGHFEGKLVWFTVSNKTFV